MTFPITSRLTDLQADRPAAAISLSRVGVVEARAGVMLADGTPAGQPCTISADLTVSLGHDQRGVHMSRFHEALTAFTDPSPDRGFAPIDLAQLAYDLARTAADRQQVSGADVTLTAQATVRDESPDSGAASSLPVDVTARTVLASSGTARTLLTVSVAGINACPCAQDLVRARASDRLLHEGFSVEEIATILSVVPGATHNQRGTATLAVGSTSVDDLPSFAQLVDVARNAMSGRIHELLKRGDELAVVLAAHARPRFVEDCVREGLATLAARSDLAAEMYGFFRQINQESIHAHDVTAERGALLRDLRAELAGVTRADAASSPPEPAPGAGNITPDAWLAGS